MSKENRSIPSLDGLRGIAVLLVIAAHLGWVSRLLGFLAKHGLGALGRRLDFDAGDLGVSIFFVISGYLITTLLLKQTGPDGRVALKDFYLRRFFRIFPPFYAYLGVVCLLWWAHLVPMAPAAMVSAAGYFANYYPYVWLNLASSAWLVGHTWSLSLEEQFYMLWPASLHWLGRRRSAWVGVGLIAVAPLSRMLTLRYFPWSSFDGQIDRMFHTRIDTIMAGCLLALAGEWPRGSAALERMIRRPWTGGAAAMALAVILHMSRVDDRVLQTVGVGLEAILLAYMLRFCIVNAESGLGRLLNSRGLRHVGLISYSLYLWQQLFAGPVHLGHLTSVPGILAATLCAAEFSYWVVERGSFAIRDRVLRFRTLAMSSG